MIEFARTFFEMLGYATVCFVVPLLATAGAWAGIKAGAHFFGPIRFRRTWRDRTADSEIE